MVGMLLAVFCALLVVVSGEADYTTYSMQLYTYGRIPNDQRTKNSCNLDERICMCDPTSDHPIIFCYEKKDESTFKCDQQSYDLLIRREAIKVRGVESKMSFGYIDDETGEIRLKFHLDQGKLSQKGVESAVGMPKLQEYKHHDHSDFVALRVRLVQTSPTCKAAITFPCLDVFDPTNLIAEVSQDGTTVPPLATTTPDSSGFMSQPTWAIVLEIVALIIILLGASAIGAFFFVQHKRKMKKKAQTLPTPTTPTLPTPPTPSTTGPPTPENPQQFAPNSKNLTRKKDSTGKTPSTETEVTIPNDAKKEKSKTTTIPQVDGAKKEKSVTKTVTNDAKKEKSKVKTIADDVKKEKSKTKTIPSDAKKEKSEAKTIPPNDAEKEKSRTKTLQ